MELFDKQTDKQALLPPLAERMRPTVIEDFVGQEHLTGDGKILHKALAAKGIFSMILWGPPGSGKTTLARIISRQISAKFFQISAVSAGVKDVRKIIDQADLNRRQGNKTILFIDEIHRFNKAQQDALLHAVESGALTLIGATTENPSFEVIAPLLSRCRVLKLTNLSDENLETILSQAMDNDIILQKMDILLDSDARQLLIHTVNGDARKLLNAIEICLQLTHTDTEKRVHINLALAREALQQRNLLYDKKGDYHYDVISALIKSVRGSDPDAAVYWLAVMLENGEDPLFVARRLIILASEDIGNASPLALSVATSGFQAVHAIGMPEAAIVLAQVTNYLAASPKSNASYLSLRKAQAAVKEGELPVVPLHLRNAPTKLMKSMDFGKGYQYPHDFPDAFVEECYLPDGMQAPGFYQPKNFGTEKFIRERLCKLWPSRYRDTD
ncbi:replication-associated recombination protein A [bacterium]|nr:replication-associated recombination protein A [bacterium]MBU1064859.1 replication-associated recombination protein A [bacterium]MBU1634243.1 replication-associated recombination protein A [bacterium]MBU1873186.1 replication-associated recombination protein A [bacterium]